MFLSHCAVLCAWSTLLYFPLSSLSIVLFWFISSSSWLLVVLFVQLVLIILLKIHILVHSTQIFWQTSVICVPYFNTMVSFNKKIRFAVEHLFCCFWFVALSKKDILELQFFEIKCQVVRSCSVHQRLWNNDFCSELHVSVVHMCSLPQEGMEAVHRSCG